MSAPVLLDVRDLKVNFYTLRGVVNALEAVSLQLDGQETLGLAGETGCGKSVTARAILRLIDDPGRIEQGSVRFEGRDLLTLSAAEMRSIRGSQISMVMQEPRGSLNPVLRIGEQVAETVLIHDKSLSRKAARERAVDMLAQVRIPDPRRLAGAYPHELSGGMAQRVMIAMMLVTRPKLLIADEPTSALDVTIQAQILELLQGLIRQFRTAVLMITHDLGVLAETCDRVAIMYAGNVVETGTARQVLKSPQHPYTQGLLQTIPDNVNPGQALYSIKGNVPSLYAPPPGCRFAPRCPQAMARCRSEKPPMFTLEPGHVSACFLHAEAPAAEPYTQPAAPGAGQP